MDVTPAERILLADAQTSGGLLLAVNPERLDELLAALKLEGTLAAAVIGRLVEGEIGAVRVSSSPPVPLSGKRRGGRGIETVSGRRREWSGGASVRDPRSDHGAEGARTSGPEDHPQPVARIKAR